MKKSIEIMMFSQFEVCTDQRTNETNKGIKEKGKEEEEKHITTYYLL